MKIVGAIGLLILLSLCGCSDGSSLKPEDSMESTLKDAQKNAASQKSDSGKKTGMVKADTETNTPDASNK